MHAAFDVEAVDGVINADLGPVDRLEGEADWTDRDISSADFRRWLLLHAGACRIVVRGARVLELGAGGSLDLTDLRLPAALVLRDCRVEPLVDLSHAEMGRLELDGCELPGGLRLDNTKVRGGVRIAGGSRLGSVEGVSVAGSNATIEGSVDVGGEGTRLEGGLRLVGGSDGGVLAIRGGAQVAADPTTGWALDADGLTVTQSLFVDGEGTRLEGALRLVGGSVGGQLAIHEGAQVAADPTTGWALDADGLTVTGDLFVHGEGTRLGGGLRLVGGSVGGVLAIRGGAQVAADVDLEAADLAVLTVRSGRLDGTLDLSHARLGRLDDHPQGWQHVAGGWRLAGITLDALSGTLHDRQTWTTARRIQWLRDDKSPSRRPFMQVADLYQQAGHRDEARTVAIAGEKATSTRWRRIWAGATVGYGYQPWRAAVAAIALVTLAWLAITPLGDDMFTAVKTDDETSCPDDYPCLNRALYLTETVVPVIEFGQRDAWRINPRSPHTAAL